MYKNYFTKPYNVIKRCPKNLDSNWNLPWRSIFLCSITQTEDIYV